MKNHYKVLIIGGGTAGIMAAAQLLKRNKTKEVAIIEPSDTHYYQPAWTLVAAGTYNFEKTARPMSSVIPKGATWIRERVALIDPVANAVVTTSEQRISYEYLIVAPGLVYDYNLVPGLKNALDKGVACSIYTDPVQCWETIKNFKGGTALFTQPTTPIKCGGAPQKIMYLAESQFRKRGVREQTTVVFASPGTVIFGIKPIAETLSKVIDRKDINIRLGYRLKKVDADNQIAWYEFAEHEKEYNHKDLKTITDGALTGIYFDFLHTAPPSVAPEFIRASELANDKGWLDVDAHSLQHKLFPNVFGLGDVAGIPTAKTGAAIRKQVPVVVDNIEMLEEHSKIGSMKYDGYSSCPLVTDYGKMVLAEFDYDNKFTPDPKLKQLLISDSTKEHWRLWLLKKYGLPYLYWNKMLKGKEV